jgi:transcriptional regulator with GAF, ATPase, and Fis domain
MSGCRLTILEGGAARAVFLNEWALEIGRDPTAGIVLRSEGVAPRHARLLRTDEGYVLVDLGSAAGSAVNGERVASRALSPGDEIRLGGAVIRYEAPDAASRAVPILDDHDPASTFRLDLAGQEQIARRLFEEGGAQARVAALYEFIRACGVLASEGVLLDAAAAVLARLPRSRRVEIDYFDAATGALKRMAAAGPHAAVAGGDPAIPRAVFDRVLVRGEAIVAGDLVAAPLRSERTIFGLLAISADGGPGTPTPEDLEFAVAFASLLENEIERQRTLLRVVNENRALRESIGDERALVGNSREMRALLERVQRAAASEATVLLLGESGTGKELVARALHAGSARRGRAFVSVNCAALQEDLLASDLFGHVRGSFTGAVADRVGKFESADGGTLFFDEIAEMPIPLQAKLLRALQEREIERVGSGTPRAVDVRVIAATNRDLGTEVGRGAFREDLFYRLNVVEIRVPPLRERLGDVGTLLDHYLEFFAKRSGKPRLRVPPEILGALESYRWPGNVRELRNLVERWVALSPGGVVAFDDLPEAIRAGGAEAPGAAAVVRTLEQLERDHIQGVLEGCGGNKTRAARILGIDRSTLYEKIEKYGLESG